MFWRFISRSIHDKLSHMVVFFMVLDLWVISRQKKGVLVIKYRAFNLNSPSKIVKLKNLARFIVNFTQIWVSKIFILTDFRLANLIKCSFWLVLKGICYFNQFELLKFEFWWKPLNKVVKLWTVSKKNCLDFGHCKKNKTKNN